VSRKYDPHRSSQLFIRSHNETLSVAAMLESMADRNRVGSRLLFLAELLESGIGT
jgi:hypothetical protein